MQGRIRAVGRSCLYSVRNFDGWAIRGTDACWPERPDDVGALLRFRVDQGSGGPALFITGRCAEFHWPERLSRL